MAAARSQGEPAAGRGLEWLIRAQNDDGSWGCEPGSEASAGLTGFALLALLSSGARLLEGPHAETVSAGVEFLVRSQDPITGRIFAFDVFGSMGLGPIFDHAGATLALGEALATMAGAEGERVSRVQGALRRAVRHLEDRQRSDGAWTANSRPEDVANLPTSALAFAALRSADRAGIPTSADLNALRVWVPPFGDGHGRYADRPGESVRPTFLSTASAVWILAGLQRLDSEPVQAGMEQLSRMEMDDDYGGRNSEWDYVAAFYASQALLLEDGPLFRTWFERTRNYLARKQNPDGSWAIEWCVSCRTLATAVAVLVLEAPAAR